MIAHVSAADEQLWAQWTQSVPVELRGKDGIKAQFAAAAALIGFLNERGNDWTFVPTEVGGWEDRKGIDGYLLRISDGAHYAVDFSLESAENPRGNKADSNWLVHLRREWFDVHGEIWTLKRSCMNLLARGFAVTLKNGPVEWRPASTSHLLAKSGA